MVQAIKHFTLRVSVIMAMRYLLQICFDIFNLTDQIVLVIVYK